MWIKICGNTSLADAEMAVDAGADALGFVFTPSPRQVTPAEARAITTQIPPNIERYGVFVHPTFDQVVDTVEAAALSGVQLHATEDPTLAARLRAYYADPGPDAGGAARKRLGLLRVLHFPADGEGFQEQLAELHTDHSADAVLVDSRTATAQGGTGLRFDWATASGSFLRAAPHLRLIVAGGLAPENVAEAIATMRPWGVDVVTGVEASPGHKDPAKVRAFIERARAASLALGVAPAHA